MEVQVGEVVGAPAPRQGGRPAPEEPSPPGTSLRRDSEAPGRREEEEVRCGMADEAPISTINNLFKPNEAARMPQEEGVLAGLPKSIARGGGRRRRE